MTIEKMRGETSLAYPGGAWTARVGRMSDEQVVAVYHRLNATGKLEDAAIERKRKRDAGVPVKYQQVSMFEGSIL